MTPVGSLECEEVLMTSSMTGPAAPEQNGFPLFSAGLRPGPELQKLITDGLHPPNPRRGWRLPTVEGLDLGVPWCGWLRAPRDGRPGEILPDLPDRREVLRGRSKPYWGLIYGLDRGVLPPLRELSSHEGAAACRLLAAAMADIAAVPIESREREGVADYLNINPTRCGQHVREGRQLWSRLGAWPWFHWPDARRPANWTAGIGAELAWLLDLWNADGNATLLERARRRQ